MGAGRSKFRFPSHGRERHRALGCQCRHAESRALIGPEINTAGHPLDLPCTWMPDGRRVLCLLVPQGRGTAPSKPAIPGPSVQESGPTAAPVKVRPGLLRDAHDEDLFDYYMTAQPTLVDISTGRSEPVGAPGIYDSVEPSPNGEFLLAIRVVRPYSYLLTALHFPKVVEVLSLTPPTLMQSRPCRWMNQGPLSRGMRSKGRGVSPGSLACLRRLPGWNRWTGEIPAPILNIEIGSSYGMRRLQASPLSSSEPRGGWRSPARDGRPGHMGTLHGESARWHGWRRLISPLGASAFG